MIFNFQKKRTLQCMSFLLHKLVFQPSYYNLSFCDYRKAVSTAPIPQKKSTKVVSHRAGGWRINVAMPIINVKKLMPINVEKNF